MTQRLALFCFWVLALGALGWYAQRTLVIGADLQLFLPSPTTAEERLVLEGIGQGPVSRVLVMALDGAAPETLAETSRALVAALANNARFRTATNGDVAIDALSDELLTDYRYLLSPTLDTQTLDAAFISAELQARLRDLASPAATLLEPLLPRDPTLEQVKLLQSWQPAQQPNLFDDVWFDAAGSRALLVAETTASAFDPERQRAALDELQRAFTDVAAPGVNLTVSGPGAFSVLMEQRTRGEAQLLGGAATLIMLLLLFVAYRSVTAVIVSALPLASAALAGLLAVSMLFDAVHGITLAFGFTLIGVAQDYPLHLLSHTRPNRTPLQAARELWPTLATGVASTCIAYATFLFSGVVGLAQLACFTITALVTAGLTTRFLLPRLLDDSGRDFGDSPWLGRLWQWIALLPRPRWAGVVVVAVCVATIVLAPGPTWENDLSKLTPVPPELLARDRELRTALGSADLRFLLVVEAADDEATLQGLEALEPQLAALQRDGAISGYDHAARYLPSQVRQLARQQRLPDAATLQQALDSALANAPFRNDVFEPFVADVAESQGLQPLTVQMLGASAIATRVDQLLLSPESGSTALVTLAGVSDMQALASLAQNAGTLLLDMKAASESLVAGQRTRLLWSLALATILLIGVVTLALRKLGRILRVLLPMALTTLIVLAILRATGVPLTLFHLIALILAAGLGLDYALFFEHAADDPREQRRSLHAILVCSLSTLIVFALLASSTLPVLRALGVTVALGVISNFVLALALHKRRGTSPVTP
jgi:predicted exporter